MGSTKILTQRQEQFVYNLFAGMSQREAYIKAGYSANQALTTLDSKSCELAKLGKVQARLEELKQGLREKIEENAISDKLERMKILTHIERAKLTDFITESGEVVLNKDIPHHSAVAEYSIKHGKYGPSTTIKLHNPVAAIDKHNEMDGIYEQKPQYQDNRTYNILVQGGEAEKEKVARLLSGEEPKQLEEG